ncbi:MAG: hypothetical protein ACFFBZ_09805 [Promethearchaeota archaeon]
MSNGSAIKKTKIQGIKSNIIEFHVTKDINFPKICIICGDNTEDKYKKTIYGVDSRDYKEDYDLNLPICNKCNNNLVIKTGISSKSGKLIPIISLIGVITAVILYILTYSIFLSIGIAIFTSMITIINYKAKTKNKLKLNDYLNIRLGANKNTLIFAFLNENYAEYIDEINFEKDTLKKS